MDVGQPVHKVALICSLTSSAALMESAAASQSSILTSMPLCASHVTPRGARNIYVMGVGEAGGVVGGGGADGGAGGDGGGNGISVT